LVDARWRHLVSTARDATAFHHPSWLALLGGQYGYEMSACCLRDSAGRLLAGMPLATVRSRLTGNRIVGLPFSDVVAPVCVPDAGGPLLDGLVQALDQFRRQRGLDLEIHATLPGLPGGNPAAEFLHHVVRLEPDFSQVERRFGSSHRRGERKALREGVSVVSATDRDGLDAFFRLHLQTRRHQGVPTQPRRFIRGFERLFAEGLGHVLLAMWQDTPIAAAVFLTWNETLTYKYGASDRRHLDKRPNNLLFEHAIRTGCHRGYRVLDLGRTDLDNPGLRAFKLGWGAEEQQLTYTRASDAASPVGHGAARRRTVGSMTRLQREVIRRSPALVSRVVGRIAYRHVG
jgi:Acetyltransferase (GNAT) domain